MGKTAAIKTESNLRDQVISALQSRISALQSQKTPAANEPPRYSGPLFSSSFVSELQWLAGDFKTERQWKREQTKKIGKELVKFVATRETQETKLKKISTSIAKDVERYWRSVAEVVKHRSKKRKAQKVKEEKSRKLEYLVNKTEIFMGKVVNAMLGHKTKTTTPAVSSQQPSEDAGDAASPSEKEESSGEEEARNIDELSDSESSLDLEEEDDSELDSRERGEAVDLLADADRPIEEILAEMQRQELEEQGEEEEEDSDSSSSSAEAGLAELEAAQPEGTTLTSSQVTIPVPALLRGQMRDYQHIGLQWLAALGDRIPGKILADEPGLGKTLQSIALLAHLACAEGIWGPHLVVVPTSVLLNWEIEFKKFCPGMKVLVYFGSAKERANLRVGWSKPNSFHVLITSYSIVLQDAHIFRRKRWYYMILDEAHNIKNFKSQRWQTLLTFNTERRLLLTGTPLSNDVSDLWALLHFLVPDVFDSHSEFSEWFGNPLKLAAEKQQLHLYQELIGRLQAMLRPFLLRRLKRDVEKQMPSKFEHVIKCPLSKRQRILYDEFIGLKETRSQLVHGSYLGMMNVLMQLRKVCNHPDLFAERPVKSPFVQVAPLQVHLPIAHYLTLGEDAAPLEAAQADKHSLLMQRLVLVHASLRNAEAIQRLQPCRVAQEEISGHVGVASFKRASAVLAELQRPQTSVTYGEFVDQEFASLQSRIATERQRRQFQVLAAELFQPADCLSAETVRAITLPLTSGSGALCGRPSVGFNAPLPPLVQTVEDQAQMAQLDELYVVQPRVLARRPRLQSTGAAEAGTAGASPGSGGDVAWRSAEVRSRVQLPDKRYLEWDCGKLKVLNSLLRRLHGEGHKCIVFTQMSKMLDILEAWINTQSYSYVRLDGGTKVEVRQALIDKFNADAKVFLFISSTRTSGVGINLTAADCVIFYDSDWSAAMDKQAIDRAHRISQTRDVHVYRLISEYTVEENIFRKQLQKRAIDEAVIDGGRFDEASIEKWTAGDVKQILDMDDAELADIYGTQTLFKQLDGPSGSSTSSTRAVEAAMAQVEDEEDVKAMQGALKDGGAAAGTAAADVEDFMSKEERAFNALPAVVKAGVRLLEERRDAGEGEGDEDEDEGDSEGVEVLMEGWESDASEPQPKKRRLQEDQ